MEREKKRRERVTGAKISDLDHTHARKKKGDQVFYDWDRNRGRESGFYTNLYRNNINPFRSPLIAKLKKKKKNLIAKVSRFSKTRRNN